jgi:hypothetical protein
MARMNAILDRRAAGWLWVALPFAILTPQTSRVGDSSKPPAQEARPRDPTAPIWTDHLKLKTYASLATDILNGHVVLVIEIEPAERIHVYAPGAENYEIITVTVAAQPFVRVLPLKYPPSEIYLFAPLQERIPVYQKPFTLRQEIVLDARPEARAAWRGRSSLTVKGTLDYQACDDKLCFNPVSVPLSWMLPLGLEAAPTAGQKQAR